MKKGHQYRSWQYRTNKRVLLLTLAWMVVLLTEKMFGLLALLVLG